jgi:hypothetical protein
MKNKKQEWGIWNWSVRVNDKPLMKKEKVQECDAIKA